MCESIRTASIPPGKPRANPGHLFHDDSRGPGIWQLIVSQPPGHLQTTTNLFRNIRSSFPTALRVKSVKGFKQSNTVILEYRWGAFIDHKRPIKAIEPFAFVFFQSEWLISWPVLCSSIELKQFLFIKIWQLIILYIDRMDWRTGHLTTTEGTGVRAFANKNCPQGRAFENFFKCPGYARGFARGECSLLELTRTLFWPPV